MRIASRRWSFIPKEGHTKYKNYDGNYVPSCTTILKILGKESLIKWANYLGWKRKRVEDELNKSSIIGTLTHAYIEQIITGREIDLSKLELVSDDVKEGVMNSLNSFIKWWKKNKHRVEVLHTELEMSGDEFGGTADLICRLDGRLCILDFKTSKSFYFTMFLQLAGYVELYRLNHEDEEEGITQIAILRMDKTNAEEAELMTIEDIIEKAEVDWNPTRMINYYISILDKIVDLFYDLHDISNDWGCWT